MDILDKRGEVQSHAVDDKAAPLMVNRGGKRKEIVRAYRRRGR